MANLFTFPPIDRARDTLRANGFNVTKCTMSIDPKRDVETCTISFDVTRESRIRNEHHVGIVDVEIIAEHSMHGPRRNPVIELEIIKRKPRFGEDGYNLTVDDMLNRRASAHYGGAGRGGKSQRIRDMVDRETKRLIKENEERMRRAKHAQPDVADTIRGLFINKVTPRQPGEECFYCNEGVCTVHTNGGWSL